MSNSTPQAATAVPPSMLRLRAALSPDATIAAVTRSLVDDWAPANDLRIASWNRDIYLVAADGTPAGLVDGPPPSDVVDDPERRSLHFYIEDMHWSIFLLVHDEKRPGDRIAFRHRNCLSLDMMDATKEVTPERARQSLDAAHALGRWLVSRFHVLDMQLVRMGGAFAPSPPKSGVQTLQQIVRRADIAAAYDDPGMFWSAWPDQQPLDDDRVLVSRAEGIVDELAFKQATYPAQWAMARAAKPGQTGYGGLYNGVSGHWVQPYEQAYFGSGEGILSAVHYDAGSQVVDATAWAEPGTHIAPREVPQLVHWVTTKQMEDGQPVSEVRVTFLDKAQAESQKRVLLDIGCRVFHYGATPGQLVELADP